MSKDKDQLELAKRYLAQDANEIKNVPYYWGFEVNEENFSFQDVMNMLKTETQRLEHRIEDWKFCAEISGG